MIPVALAACTNAELWEQIQELAGRKLGGEREYVEWLEGKHSKLVCGYEMTNAMAVFNLVIKWRAETRVLIGTG